MALLCLAPSSLALHLHLERGLTHTVGVFIVLAELLGKGIFYPAQQSLDLVYSTLYHPLAFAPIALLPGHGLDVVPALRVLVGAETIACLGLLAWLAKQAGQRGLLAWQPSLWALCTVPVGFSLLGMRDDPRAVMFALLAVAVHLRGGRRAAFFCGGLLVLAFLTKATAPLAPGLALSVVLWRRGGRMELARLWLTCALGTFAAVAFLQWGIGCDFLGNGLHYALFHPAKDPRSWAETFSFLGRDLSLELALPLLLGASASSLLVQVARRRKLDLFDLLVLAVWLKTVLVYRSTGTDLNHLLDLTLFSCLQLAVRLGPHLRTTLALALLLLLMLLGGPFARLLPERGAKTLQQGRIAQAATLLRSLPSAPTLVEEPLLAWMAKTRPLITDPLLTFSTLEAWPRIRTTWFGPPDRPGALQRLVLMRNPFPELGRPDPEDWYGPLHFDREFLEQVRAHWRVVASSEGATALVRKSAK